MSNPLKQQIDILVQYQSIEADQHKIEKRLKDIPNQIDALENKLKTYEQELENEKKKVEDVKKEYKAYESAVKDNLEKAKKSEFKLAEVKNNKEYQSILKEIDELKKKNDLVEDKMLECLDFLDQEEDRLKVKKTEFDAIKIESEEDKKDILEEGQKEKERLAALEAEKQEVLNHIDAQMMTQYEKVRGVVGRIVMARVENALCHACNMNMPPQRYHELLKCEEIILCPHCHRILYWEDQKEASVDV